MYPPRSPSPSMADWKASQSAIHERGALSSAMSVLLKASTKGSCALYSTEQAYSMLAMKVVGEDTRAVSTTNTTTVGNSEIMLVMSVPEADHANTSIWPGVSTRQ